jgi:PTH1 family peptidyl-tRNA hydrolase
VSCLKVIVGLGNPGVQYRFTRHNIGFMVVDCISESLGLKFKHIKSYYSLIARGRFDNKKILLVKPQTYMNLSGIAVKKITSYYKIPAQDILIVYDDFNLGFEQIRIRKRGSSGGHNGIESVIENLNSEAVPRIRIGIGQNQNNQEIQYSDYVLSQFTKSEKSKLTDLINRASDAVKTIITEGFDLAMRDYNAKPNLK